MHKPHAMQQTDRVLDTSDALVRSLGNRFPASAASAAAALAVTLGRIVGTAGLDLDALCGMVRSTAEGCR